MTFASIWRLIKKTGKIRSGTYKDWKPDLAAEAHYRCVYCGILDEHVGGTRSFHVDHFRPKILRKDLENEYSNLFYSCAACNVYKGDEWPGEPNVTGCTFLCPTDHDFSMYLLVKGSQIAGLCIAADYMIERLHLNRPKLQILRREAILRSSLHNEGSRLKALRRKYFHNDLGVEAELQSRLMAVQEQLIGAYQALEEAYATTVDT